ncbi:MAG: PqqD family protein [Proteobacteria bacterium]|nr:PqqD family protein [Pseudomonadota bacterium]
MEARFDVNAVYVRSENVVAQDFEGELFMVPVTAGLEGEEDETLKLNETGKTIWDRLDGERSVKDLIGELAAEYKTPPAEIEADVVGLMKDLSHRRLIIAKDHE